LDDYISEVGILTRKADEEMRVREIERQDAVRREAQAAKAAAGVCVCDCVCDFLFLCRVQALKTDYYFFSRFTFPKLKTHQLYCCSQEAGGPS
jgi:hypothetical protein